MPLCRFGEAEVAQFVGVAVALGCGLELQVRSFGVLDLSLQVG